MKPVDVPEVESPIQTLDTTATDGRAVCAFWSKPKVEEPLPDIVFIHGALTLGQANGRCAGVTFPAFPVRR